MPPRPLWLLAALVVVAAGCRPGGSPVPGPPPRIALILPGAAAQPPGTADERALRAATAAVHGTLTVRESVTPAAAEQAAAAAVAGGARAVAFAGPGYEGTASRLAARYPKVSFIEETTGRRPGLPANVWNLGRELYLGYYALGILGGALSAHRRVAFVAGVRRPDVLADLNAVRVGSERADHAVVSVWSFAGDPGPESARQAAAGQVAQGADILVAAPDAGVAGVLEAARAAPGVRVLLGPGPVPAGAPEPAAHLVEDLRPAYLEALRGIGQGRLGGYAAVRPGSGLSIEGLGGLPAGPAALAARTLDGIAAGRIPVPDISDRIYPAPST